MSLDAIAHGLTLGIVYGALAVGLVLVYRATGVVNFAHGEMGALGAAVLAKLVLDEHWPSLAALPLVLALGGSLGAATHLLVGRRLRERPRLVFLVATIGLAQLLIVGQLLLPDIREVASYPTLMHRRLSLGSVVLTGRDFVPLAVIPAIVVALALWLARTPTGRALRAVGDDDRLAEVSGLDTDRIALLAWVLAGLLATATAVLADPLQGVIVGRPTEALGAGLMVRALAAALVGRMRSLTGALVGGVAVGLIQAWANAGGVDPAVADVVLLAFVLAVTLLRPTITRVRDGALLAVPPVARVSRWVLVVVIAAAALPVVFGRSSQLFSLSRIELYALAGLSLVLLTGWAGQLSLGQFALVGTGTFVAAILERNGVPFWITLGLAAGAGAAVSALVGLPALRVRGLELAVTTLALGVACGTWLFTRSTLLDATGSVAVFRARVVRGPASYYELCLAALVATAAGLSKVRRSDVGRRLLAVKSNDKGAAALGVSPVATKVLAFALAGALAALAGALFGALRVHSGPADFGPDESLRIVAITVIGGAGTVAGAVVGAIVVLGLPVLFGDTTIAGLLPSGIGLLVLSVAFPAGLTGLRRLRPAASPLTARPRARRGPRRLQIRDLTVRFDGRVALDNLTLDVAAGEVVGLVGPNGAGKTTLLDAVSGFLTPAAGTILLDGEPIDHMSPAARARAGIGRVFQDAALFDDLTVAEVLALAGGHSEEPTRCQELTMAERRRVALEVALATGPSVLLLDEPTAGLDDEEARQFVATIAAVRADPACTILLVLHDVALATSVCDRLVVLDAGVVAHDVI